MFTYNEYFDWTVLMSIANNLGGNKVRVWDGQFIQIIIYLKSEKKQYLEFIETAPQRK